MASLDVASSGGGNSNNASGVGSDSSGGDKFIITYKNINTYINKSTYLYNHISIHKYKLTHT